MALFTVLSRIPDKSRQFSNEKLLECSESIWGSWVKKQCYAAPTVNTPPMKKISLMSISMKNFRWIVAISVNSSDDVTTNGLYITCMSNNLKSLPWLILWRIMLSLLQLLTTVSVNSRSPLPRLVYIHGLNDSLSSLGCSSLNDAVSKVLIPCFRKKQWPFFKGQTWLKWHLG